MAGQVIEEGSVDVVNEDIYEVNITLRKTRFNTESQETAYLTNNFFTKIPIYQDACSIENWVILILQY